MNIETPRKPGARDQHLPRYPSRANGKERFESLLDTLADMLSNRETSDFGLAELGERAGATTASVYHFFPSKEAAIIALAERYLVAYASRVSEEAKKSASAWQEILENCSQSALEYNEANPLAMRIFFGSDMSWRIRQLDLQSEYRLASIISEAMRDQFGMDHVPDLEERVVIAITIGDAIWGLSYAHHQRITPEYHEQAREAGLAYLTPHLSA